MSKTLMTSLDLHIRWSIRRDMPEIVSNEQACFEYPWTEEDFLNSLRQRNCIGMVAEHKSRIVGHMVYELEKDVLRLLNFAVQPGYQRHGVGREMATKLINKLSQQRRHRIITHVRETNLDAQLFFSNLGFIATGVERDWFEDTDEDAYRFVYDLPFGCGR